MADKRVTVNGAVARASRLLVRGDVVVVDAPRVRAAPPAPAGRHPADDRVRGRAPRRHRQAGRPGGAPGAGTLGRHPGQRAGGARDDPVRRRRGAAGDRAPARPRHLGAHAGGQDGPGAPPPGRTCSRPGRSAGVTPRSPGGTSTRAPRASTRRSRRHPNDRKRMAVLADGRAARTDAWCVARFEVADLLRLELHTGRTHQIRVHLAHIGHPVIGDPVYGAGGSRRISGQAAPDGRGRRAAGTPAGAACRAAFVPASGDRSRPSNSAPNGRPICAPGAGRSRQARRCLLLPPRLFAIFVSLIGDG